MSSVVVRSCEGDIVCSDEFVRRSFMRGRHRSLGCVRSSFFLARVTSLVRMSPFVVRSCEGDIVRSDGFVRRSFMRSLLLLLLVLLFLLLLLLLLLSPLTSPELILCGCCGSMIFFSCRS